jgi:hypothetical protein
MTMESTVDDPAVVPYLPTLAGAREGCVPLDPEGSFELPEGEPSAVRRLAAMVVSARVVRRETRDEETEVSIARASYMLKEMPPAPREYLEQSYLIRLRGDSAAGRPCTGCDIRRRGSTICHCCGGTGRRLDPPAPCTACDEGFILCAMCDGTGEIISAEVRYVNDVPIWYRDTFIPEAFRYLPSMFSVPTLLRALLAEVDPPMALAVPLMGKMQGSAYRDAKRSEADPVFHGHRFEDAIEAARRSLRGLMKPKTEIVLHDVRSFAWPFLWVEYGTGREKREMVLVVRPDLQLAGFVGE